MTLDLATAEGELPHYPMTFNPLDHALRQLVEQSDWDGYPQYLQLLEAWKQVVEEKVARQTRPLYISRNILWVATASAAWAQTLSFARRNLIKELSNRLEVPLDDIRFSTARWSDRTPTQRTQESAPIHPSQIDAIDWPETAAPSPSPLTAQDAFERWSAMIQWRSRFLTPCPCCQLPTPAGEIERWSMCVFCIRQAWGNSASRENP